MSCSLRSAAFFQPSVIRSAVCDVLRELFKTIENFPVCQLLFAFLLLYLQVQSATLDVHAALEYQNTGTANIGCGALSSYILINCSGLGLDFGWPEAQNRKSNAWTALRLPFTVRSHTARAKVRSFISLTHPEYRVFHFYASTQVSLCFSLPCSGFISATS